MREEVKAWGEEKGGEGDVGEGAEYEKGAEESGGDDGRAVLTRVRARSRGMGMLGPNLVIQDPLYHDQTPCNNQRLDRIREGVGLVRPCDVRGSHQYHGQPSLPRRLHKLMYCPVFQHETQDEHEDA